MTVDVAFVNVRVHRGVDVPDAYRPVRRAR